MSNVGSAPTAPAAREELSSGASGNYGRMHRVVDSLVGGVPLGDTDVGKSWCIKALHPADVNVLSSPMPTNETRSFASVAFNQMGTIVRPAAFAATTWNLEIYVHRDPVLLYSWRATQSGAADVTGYVYSLQYSGIPGGTSTYTENFDQLRHNVEKYRLTSHSVTAYFDAADQTNQGHIVAGQTDIPWLQMAATTVPAPVLDISAQCPWVFYQDATPTLENILQTSRCYQGAARDGVYAPSKLQNLGAWVKTNETNFMLGSITSPFAEFGRVGFSDWPHASQALNDFVGTFPWTTPLGGPVIPVFSQTDSTLTTIFIQNIAPTSAVRTTMRWSLDLIVRPGTVYAPFVRMPPVEDRGAIKMYAEVSRRMADAYPGNHNSLAALLPVIAGIAKTVFPIVYGLAAPAARKWLKGRKKARTIAKARGKPYKPASFLENLARRALKEKGGPSAVDAIYSIGMNAAPDILAGLRQVSKLIS